MARVARLTTVGELVASITHEINQPLTAIATNGRACSNWLERAVPDFAEAQGALERIQRDVGRAAEVIRSLRALVTKSDPKRTWLDVNDVIREVIALTQSDLDRHGVALFLDLSERAPRVFADRVQLQQVLLNLIMNGAEAMSAVADKPRRLTVASAPAPTGGTRVSVADSGVGLDAATAERVFESFFTTKAAGMGMGLSICRSIIAAHGGQIGVEANAPRGANFHFTLPVGGEAVPDPAPAEAGAPP